jgi:N-acetylneuraminic acid mutarotase
MQKQSASSSIFFRSHLLLAVMFCIGACLCLAGALLAFQHGEAPSNSSNRTLTFEERVSYQRAIEEVYWRHRIWPKENLTSKPSLDAVMSQMQLENKVSDYLRNSQALADYWQRPITAEQLQTEMDRMAQNTRQPEVLQELFEALGNDPFVIAECLARPALAARLSKPSVANQVEQTNRGYSEILAANGSYTLPTISDTAGGCMDNTWSATSLTGAPSVRNQHTAVWTGTEMIVWGGFNFVATNTGARYNPSTDSWTATSDTNAPPGRVSHTAVWTGSEMIIWSGSDGAALVNTGGRYNPATNSWTATNTSNAPEAREWHTAVWTGSEMIVWGGFDFFMHVNTGGRYDPGSNSWTETSTTNAPSARSNHTAVWTGVEMIIWGGSGLTGAVNTGGRYNPATNSWTATNTSNAPEARLFHTAVWTGGEMIVWGGNGALDTGGKYNPGNDSWTATNTSNAPEARRSHTAVWTGSEMIVWGGVGALFPGTLNTGGRYDPDADSWRPTSTINVPDPRNLHTAVWTDREMIVWGGFDGIRSLNTGGRYCVQSGPLPTPTPTPSITPTPSPTPTPTPPGTGGTVHGGGTIQTANGAAYFGVGVSTQTKGKGKGKAKAKAKRKVKGQFSYRDPARGIDFGTKKFSSLIVTGNRATLSGRARVGKRKIRFTAIFIDNGNPGTRDNFSISLKTGYSADNKLSTGNVEIF